MTHKISELPGLMEEVIAAMITSLRVQGVTWDGLSSEQQDDSLQDGIRQANDQQAAAVRAKLITRRPGLQPHEVGNGVACVQMALWTGGVTWDRLSTEEQDTAIDDAIRQEAERRIEGLRVEAARRAQAAYEANPLACPQCHHDDRVQKVSSVVDGGTVDATLKGTVANTSVTFGQEGLGSSIGSGPVNLKSRSTTALAARLMPPVPPNRPGLFAGRDGRRKYGAALRRYVCARQLWEALYYCARDDGVYWPGGRGFYASSGQELTPVPWTVGRLFPIAEYWNTLFTVADAGVEITDPSRWVGEAAVR
jgi:hypothetical protein